MIGLELTCVVCIFCQILRSKVGKNGNGDLDVIQSKIIVVGFIMK